jgi:tetratricopeptide (TPR) repeat protein
MADVLESEGGGEPETSPDPISSSAAMAIGVRKRGAGGKADAVFDSFLRDQQRLINLQTEHLHEQRELQLAHLRVRRWKDRMSLALQAFGVAGGAAIAVGLGVMAWTASQDRALVIEPFSSPPGFVQQGVTGEVLAADVMARLDGISRMNGSPDRPRDLRGSVEHEVKVEIPETGISVADVWRAMRDWFGHERKISGSLTQTPDGGVRLRAQLEGAQSWEASGGAADLPMLEQQIAEQIASVTDPFNWLIYLGRTDRRPEALSAIRRRLAGPLSPLDRAHFLSIWATGDADPRRALRVAKMSERADPKLMAGWIAEEQIDRAFGYDEAAVVAWRGLEPLKEADQPPDQQGQGVASFRSQGRQISLFLSGDYMTLEQALAKRAQPQDLLDAEVRARLHDIAGARAALARTDVQADTGSQILDNSNPNRLAREDGPDPTLARWEIAAASGDWTAALAEAQGMMLHASQVQLGQGSGRGQQFAGAMTPLTVFRPRLAESLARLGRFAEAEAAIAPTPLDCYACLRERGRVAALQNKWPEAERWFSEAARQGPSLPFAYLDWAQALLARGDAAGAIAKLRLAHEKGPNFADPLELWGEALTKQSDYAGGIAKFAEADRSAPNWGRNHLLWGEALMLSGRYAEARRQYEIANRLDLSLPDRAALKVLLARTASGPLHG